MILMPVIIPAYHKPEQLWKCREALKAQIGVTPLAFVHDNSEKNIGFTAAVNRGLRWAIDDEHKYAVVLNQDCYLEPDALANLHTFMEAHPRCAIAGVKQVTTADPDLICHGGCTMAFPTGVHVIGRVSRGDCAVARQMPWVNGACMCFRLEALRQFGLMDEGMFLIGSDSDICYTSRLRGWEVWYCPDAVCQHEGGESGRPSSNAVIEIMRKDMAYWADKWVGSQAFARLSRDIH